MFFGLINALAGTCRCRRFSSDASPDLAANELRWGQSKRFYAAVASKVKLFFFFLFLFQQFHNLASPIEGDFPNTIFTINCGRRTSYIFDYQLISDAHRQSGIERESARVCQREQSVVRAKARARTQTHTHRRMTMCETRKQLIEKTEQKFAQARTTCKCSFKQSLRERESARHDRPRSERVIRREEM